MAALVSARGLCRDLEEWWGSSLDDDLVTRIMNAPPSHVSRFTETVHLTPHLSQIKRGQLRPAVHPTRDEVQSADTIARTASAGLRLLLYAHEIVLDVEDLPFGLGWQLTDRVTQRQKLTNLVRLRPLIDDRLITFTSLRSQSRHPSRTGWDDRFTTDPRYAEIAKSMLPPGEDDLENLDATLRFAVGKARASYGLAQMNLAHVLTRTVQDEHLAELLLGTRGIDRRLASLNVLAALPVPSMNGDVRDLVQVRRSDGAFAEWRQRLGSALDHVGQFRDDADATEAAAIVSQELEEGLAALTTAVRRSPALTALRRGSSGFAITSVSALTGFVTGSAMSAVAAGAVANTTAAAVLAYLNARRERSSQMLIHDLALSFRDPTTE